jgi:hypothetical protein
MIRFSVPKKRLAALSLSFIACVARPLGADPLSKKQEVDFFHDVASRDLHGLATRSDGRLVAGPVVTDLSGPALAQLLWCLEPGANNTWLIGSGPDGKILEATVDASAHSFTSREFAKLDDAQVFALKRLPDGSILAGTSPRGGLYWVRAGQVVARVGLPADSIFDIRLLGGDSALIGTGNPGRIYRVDLSKFEKAGVSNEKTAASSALEAKGITLFGAIRDRNVRRIALLSDGRVVAGSSPDGTIYRFEASGGDPFILVQNHESEVTDFLPGPGGDLLASVITTTGESRLTLTIEKPKDSGDTPPPARQEKFDGRSALVRLPANGFPETVLTRAGATFYRLALRGNVAVMAGGEQGDIRAYDLSARLSLTFAGSNSARLNDMQPMPGSPDRLLLLRNNAPGLTLMDFGASAAREAQTSAIDLGGEAQLGAVRFKRLRELADRAIALEVKTSNSSDDLEGWSPWTPFVTDGDGWHGPLLRGRYVKLRLKLPQTSSSSAEIDKASLYFLPRNRRPQLQEFHLLTPNFSLVPPAPSSPPVTTTLGQIIQGRDEDKHKNALLSGQVVPSPGSQVAFWTVTDPDGDNVVYTFSIRRDGETAWTDLSVDSGDAYVEFDTNHLPDGLYFTRLVAKETAPRPASDRLSVTFETDDLMVDHTPPAILETTARRSGDTIVVSVHGKDALSLLDGIEVDFNNGAHETVEQPIDGIRDSREETFVLEEPLSKASGATGIEVTLYDASGNSTTKHLAMPK